MVFGDNSAHSMENISSPSGTLSVSFLVCLTLEKKFGREKNILSLLSIWPIGVSIHIAKGTIKGIS